MGTTLTRPRSGFDTTKPGGGKESPKVTNLLLARGRTVSGPPPVVNRPPDGKLPKSISDGQFKEFGDRVKVANEAIAADLKVLEMIPGMADAVAEWKAKQETASKPQKIGDWKGSLKLLEMVQKALHEQIVSKKDEMSKTLVNSGQQRKQYETLHGELSTLSDRLAAYPNAGMDVKAIDDALKAGAVCYAKDDFAGAVKALQDAKIAATQQLATLDKMDKAVTGSDRLKPLYKRLGVLDGSIEKASTLLGNAAVQTWQNTSRQLYANILRAGTDDKLKDAAVKDTTLRLDTIELEIQQRTDEAARLRADALRVSGELQQTIAVSGEFQPADEVKQAYAALANIRQALGEFRYADANTGCTELAKIVKVWSENQPVGPVAVAKAGVDKFKTPAETEMDRAQKLAAAAGAAPILDTPPTAASVVEMLEKQLAIYKSAPNTFPLSEGLQIVASAKKINNDNEERKAAYEKLAEARATCGQQIETLAEGVREAIAGMKTAIADKGAPVASLPSYEDPLRTILDDWKDASATAMTEPALRFADFQNRLQTLLQDIKDDTANPVKVSDKAAEGRYAALAAAFKEQTKTTDAAIETLVDVDYENGDAQRVKADAAADTFRAAIKERDPAAAQKAIDELVKIATDAKSASDKANSMYANSKLALDTALRDIGEAITQLETRAKDGKLADYAKLVAAFRTECAQLGATGSSKDASVINGSIDQLYALRGKVNALKTLFDKIAGGTVSKTDITVGSLKDRAASLLKTFNDPNVTKYEAAKLKDLTDKHTAAAAEIGTVPLGDSATKLTEIDNAWKALVATAAQHAKDAQAYILTITQMKADFETKGATKEHWDSVPDYKKALVKKLDALSAAAAKDGTLDQAALADIKAEIIKAITVPGAAKIGNDKAQTDELTEKTAEKAWTAEYLAFQGKIKGLKAILTTLDGPPAENFKKQIAELEDSASIVKKSEGKTPYATMCDQLKALAGNAETMRRFPMGQATASRGQVMAADKAWNAAVAQFHKVLDALPEEVAKALGTDPNAKQASDAVAKKLTEARKLIVPGTITAMAKKMVDAKDDIGAARDAREEALREIKRLQRLVLGAPQFMPLAGNPFGVNITVELGNLNAALFSIETALSISL
jgi:hypothetical protein